jgi:toxin ParE1/3/4
MSCYRLSRQADADLDEIAEHIAADNADAADRVLNALSETFVALARSPGIGQRREDLRPGLRVFPATRPAHNYVVFYYPIPDGIEVATVLHGHRDWIGLFEQGER